MPTVLFVDDEPALLDIGKLFLERTGDISIITADSAKGALEILQKDHIDVIVSDYEMPDMNGIELLKEVRRSGNTIPFIIYTGRGREEVVIQALDAGADSYIQKMGDPKSQFNELIEKITKVMRWKTAEDEVRRKGREWDGIFHSIGESALVIDSDQRIISANQETCTLFGKPEEELIGRRCHSLFHNTDEPPADCPLKKTLISRSSESGEITSDILQKTFIISCTPVLDEQGEIEKIIHIATDITDIKKTERELKRYRDHLEELVKERTYELGIAKEQAEAANRTKTTFLSNMSHELRTPLNAILGYTQILSRHENLTQEQKEQLNTVYSSGKNLLSLINDLLDLSKIEAQSIRIEEKPFNLTDLLKEVYNITRINAEEKNLTFRFDTDFPVFENIMGDPGKIKQILINLLNNAIKNTYTGGIVLKVSYGVIGSDILRCDIIDTGIGIPEDKQEEIFTPFTQLSTDGEITEGAGLGLAITKSLIDLMHGTLTLDSAPGRGSTFTVQVQLPKTNQKVSEESENRVITGYRGDRKKILVVDDNPSNSSLLVSLLEPLGFTVLAVHNGSDAVSQAKSEIPDLILLDLIMTGMDGLDVLNQIRKDPGLDSIRIIGISAAVSLTNMKPEFKESCDDFLIKPIQIDLLLRIIGKNLGIVWIEKELGSYESDRKDMKKDDQLSKIPDEDILRSIELAARQGNFKKIKTILAGVQNDNILYTNFSTKIRQFADKFDDDAIIAYTRSVR